MDDLQLIGFQIENMLAIKALSITMPEDGNLVLGGENEAGKSSALDSLELAFAGGDATKIADPLHGDATKGRVLATFDGLTLEKVWKRKKDGGVASKLVVKDADGKTQSSPQSQFARLINYISLDLLKFLKKDEEEQARIICEIWGVDLAPFEARRKAAYDARRDANVSVTRLKSALAILSCDSSMPAEETSVSELSAQLKLRREHNEEGDRLDGVNRDAAQTVQSMASSISAIDDQVAELHKKRAEFVLELEEAKKIKAYAVKALAAFQPADEEQIVATLDNLETVNKAVRANVHYNSVKQQLADAQAIADKRQAALDAVDVDEAAALAEIEGKIPVAGLTVKGNRPFYNGKPLSQAGTSASLRVAAAIAMAANKDSQFKFLLIDDGEGLSPKHQRQVMEDATANGFGVIMTMVSGRGPSHVEIVDGVGSNE